MEGLVIRIATVEDAPTIAQFNAWLALETENKQLDLAHLTAGATGLIQSPQYGFYLVAVRDGVVIGQLMITYEWSDWQNGVYWWIASVYVHNDHRGQGVFHSLYAKVKELAKANGSVRGLRLYVERENEAALAVYNKMGMELLNYDLVEEKI